MAFFFSESAASHSVPAQPDLILSADEASRQTAMRREQRRIARTLATRLLGASSAAPRPSAFIALPARRRPNR